MTTAYPNRDPEGDRCEQLLGQAKQQGDATLDEAHTSLEPDHGSKRLTFNSGPRSYRDTTFTFLFIGAVLITYAFGIFAVKNAHFNPESQYNPTTGQCEVIHQHAHAGNTSAHAGSLQGRHDTGPFNMAVQTLVPILSTLILITPVGFFMLWILHRYTRRAVVASLPLQCFFPLATLTSAFAFCSRLSVAGSCWDVVVSPSLGLVFVVSLLVVWMVSKDWSRLDLVVQVLKSSLHVLRQNLLLLMLYPILSLVVILIDAPIITFIVYATYNGKISPDFDAIERSHDGCNQTTGPPCCRFEVAGWAIAYYVLAGVAALWVMSVTTFLQHFVVSGAIADWYAAPPGASSVGFTKRSLRYLLSP